MPDRPAAVQSGNRCETIVQVLHDEPVSPRQLNPLLPRDLETICGKCLQKDGRRRYPSAAALADDLSRWLAGEPIEARPVGRFERAGKWVKRRPSLATLAAVVALLVFGIVAGTLGYLQQRSDKAARGRLELTAALLEAEGLEKCSWDVAGNPHVWAATLAEAQSALERVQRARNAVGQDIDSPLTTRVQELEQRLAEDDRDRHMVTTVNQIRIEKSVLNVMNHSFASLEALPRYRMAFSQYGLEAGVTDRDVAAARLRSKHPAVQTDLLAALDDWLTLGQDAVAERSLAPPGGGQCRSRSVARPDATSYCDQGPAGPGTSGGSSQRAVAASRHAGTARQSSPRPRRRGKRRSLAPTRPGAISR